MKVKNIFKSKRKSDLLPRSTNQPSASGMGTEASSQQADNPSETAASSVSLKSKDVTAHQIQEVSASLEGIGDKVEITKPERAADDFNTEDAVSSLSITETYVESNPRVRSAKEQLLDASASLTETLKLYRNGHKNDGFPFLDDDAKLGEPGEHLTAEQVVGAVDAVISQQQDQKPTAASRVGSVIGKIYPLASLAMGVGATVAESASFVPVKGAVNGLCLLLSIANQEQGRSADFLRQLDRISYQALRVAEIQKHGDIDIGDLVLESSTKLMTSILLFFKGAVMFFRHDYFFNLGKTILLGPQVYADAKSTLDTAINDYDQALLLQATIKVLKMQAPPVPTDGTGLSKKSELLTWLESSYWDVESEYCRHCEDRAPGTLEWVLEAEQFKDWRLSDRRSRENRALWLNGLPGVGKSTIAAYITQVLKAQYPDAAVLYFFCKSGDPSLDNVIKIVRTLAAQLLLAVPAARVYLQTLKDDNYAVSESIKPILQMLVRDSLAGMLQDVFVIIDGYDECENTTDGRGGDSPLELLLEGLLNSDVKLLLSSRPTPEIARTMSTATRRDFTYEDSRDDIQSYVSTCILKSKILEKGFKSMEKDPVQFIADKSQGNFLWVKIVLNILKNKTSTKDFQEVIETIPKDLEDVYDQLLTRLDASGSLGLALTIIRCVLFPIRALSIGEIEVAVNILQGDVIDLKDFVESYCGSFLRVIPGKTSGLYIVHETFRSYITTRTSSKEKCILPGSSHAQLATACVACLGEQENTEVDPFRAYAAEYWLEHLASFMIDSTQTSREEVSSLIEYIRAFLQSSGSLRDWMKQYVFLCTEPYVLGFRVASMHDIVVDLFKDHSENPWDDDFRHRVSDDFLYIWINTDWKEVDTAKYVLEGAYTARSILSPPPDSLLDGGKRRERLFPRNENKITYNQGWTFQYSGDAEIRHKITLGQLQELADAANYNNNIGVQCGNHAFGELVAGSDHCIQNFQNAIDEQPECWHLYEGLGSYYEQHGKREDAIRWYAEAIKVDTKNPASASFNHWSLVAEKKEEDGDVDGAVEAWKLGVANVPDNFADRYWDAMVKIREKSGNGNAMAELYEESIKKHPGACYYFTKKLAEVYGRGGARQRQYQTYRDAMKIDPENIEEYGKEIRKFAVELKDLCTWPPVDFILADGIESDPDNASKYHKELGLAHMCRRNWKQAIDHLGEYARLEQDDWAYLDIGNGYLGMGNIQTAVAAYNQAIKTKTNYMGLARHIGFAHVVEENYTQAIRLFKLALNDAASNKHVNLSHSFMQTVDDMKPLRLFELHRALGLCYEAMGRTEDMTKSLEAAVTYYRDIALQMDEDKDRDTFYRHEARGLFEVGLVLEKLGKKEEALDMLSRAAILFEKTSLNPDDEVQSSEATEATAAIGRLSLQEEQGDTSAPDLKEKYGEMRLQRRLALKYTTDWYCFKQWKPPRQRGGMDWNEVSFTNKFKVSNGDRTFIAPWGFGHGE
ncbi:hypothetical protein IFR05_000228 [Cadophora sp. M221]|nr:hypothetical protein IFR05_000228 [Cadophora sp. M221]